MFQTLFLTMMTEIMIVGYFLWTIICIDISWPYITPRYKLTIGAKSREAQSPTLMHFCTSWSADLSSDQVVRVFNWKSRTPGNGNLIGKYAKCTVHSAPPELDWLWLWLQQLIWGIRRLLGWRYWCRQWSNMVSRSYITWVGKKHNCRHFQWQSEGRLLFLYDGQGNMLLIV